MTMVEMRIEEFASTGSGGTPARKFNDRFYGGDIPWVKSGELRDDELNGTEETITAEGLRESAAKLIEPGCVLVALYGATVGRTALLTIPAATNQAICYIRTNETVALTRYVWYALRNNIGSFLRQRVGGAQPNISQGVIRATSIPIRGLSEQRRIVDILSEVDDLRRQRAKTDTTIQRLLPAVYEEMFGDPATNPKGWTPTKMRELFAIPPNYGTMIPPKRKDGGDWLSLRVANISNGKLDLRDRRYVDLPENMIKRHGVLEGDLLLARAIGSLDHLGKCFIAYPPKGEQWAFDSHLMRVRFNRALVEPEMIRGFLTSPGGRTLFLSKTRKSAVQFNINTKEFASIEMPLPPIELQREYVARVANIEQIETRASVSADKLARLYQVLLHRAFTGELTAKWRAKHRKQLEAELDEQRKVLEQSANDANRNGSSRGHRKRATKGTKK